jgi:hypothetical protein
MNEVLHANVFFFITGIAVIIFTALLCVALFHIIRLLKTLRRIVDRVDAGAEAIHEDMQNIRSHLASGGVIRKLVRFFFGAPAEADETEEDDFSPRAKKAERKKTALKIKDES